MFLVSGSGTRHGGSQKKDFCRRSDGKSFSWLDDLRIGEFLEAAAMFLAYMEVLHPSPLPVVCSFT